MTRTFTAVIHKEDTWYVADCPEVGTVSQGKTVEEAVANLKEATELVLEEAPLKEFDHPLVTTFDVSLPDRSDAKVGEQPASYVVEENKSSLDWSFPNIEVVEGA
ncbi:MAG: type II toxin-antitoxin system HicB family antitoxin, partial [Anaerolineales bacterium]|nr:type II toxin-antitoxin system HicB family antitoxin [Anaerolineales bacterium]